MKSSDTKDALVAVQAPPSGGFTGSVFVNAGTINNHGTEFTLSVLPVERTNFVWESRIAHSTLHNSLVSWGGAREEPLYSGFVVAGTGVILAPGKPLGTLFGTRPSLDANGNIMRTAGGAIIANDTVFFGGSLPTRTLSWDNNFRIARNLRFGIQFDHQAGHYQLNLTRRTRTIDGLVPESQLYSGSTKADSLVNELLRSGGGAQYMEKRDFTKLREVSLSYSLPSRFTRSFGSDQVVLSVAGRNLGTWTDYTGTDPETNADSSDFLIAETNAIPPARRITASLMVRF